MRPTLLLLWLALAAADVGQIPSPQTLSKWKFVLETKLGQLATQLTHLKFAQKAYESDLRNVRLREINGEGMLKQTLSKMQDLLDKKESALQRLVRAAEGAVVGHRFSSQLGLAEVPFLNMKEVKKGDERLAYSSAFLQNVTFNESGVHIPLEIYEGYPQILNGLKWSAALEPVFKENLRLDPNLRWQYFGSQRGFMRVYPAFRWPEMPNLPDLFDVRRRSWYIQGSVSPKDMIIMIDTSGSVHGQTFDIMKIAVKAMLHTLGENDYVNVAWFNNDVDWVVPCLSTLVQATGHHKRLLFDAVDQLQEGNFTSYATALEFAYEAFRRFEDTRQPYEGSNCHKVIMFFTDGGTEWPEDVIRRYQNDTVTRHVRIFAYASGPHPIPTVILKSIACTTNGYYSTITALAAIRPRIQDYVRILGRPLVQSGDDTLFQWSNFYRDIGGLGMMTTVTLPVANLTEPNNPSLVGVMGVDVSLSEVEAQYSRQLLGPLGYGFAINPNGFVVFHPRLQDQIAYIEEPPDLDILELEGRKAETEKLRDAMVAGETGRLLNVSHVQILDSKHALPVRMNFFYGQIGNSTFRFCLAIPVGHVALEVSGVSHEAGLRLESYEGVLLAPWHVCDGLDDDPSVTLLSEAIANNTHNCSSKGGAQHLLWDATKISQIWKEWAANPHSKAKSRFVFTSSGITAVYPETEKMHYMSQRDPNINGFYKRASRAKAFLFGIKNTKRNGLRAPSVVVGHKVVVRQQEKVFVAAVVGAEVEQKLVNQIFHNATSTGGVGGEVLCDRPDELVCYLVDQAALIVATNQPDAKIGGKLGDEDPQVMSQLLGEGVFEREHRYTYQAWCPSRRRAPAQPDPNAMASASPGAVTWARNVLGVVEAAVQGLVASSLLLWGLPGGADSITISSVGGAENERNFSCVTRSTWLRTSGRTHSLGAFECDEAACVRPVTAAHLPDVGLILVVADAPCHCQTNEHLRTTEKDPDICNMKKSFRVRPGTCYDHDNSTDCGVSAGSLRPTSSRLVTVLALLLATSAAAA